MAKRRITGRVTSSGRKSPADVKRLSQIREKVREEFPPRLRPATEGIAARIRAARLDQGLTWYAVAKRAGIRNPSTVRDLEYGRDTKLSSLQAVAEALGLRLELVEA